MLNTVWEIACLYNLNGESEQLIFNQVGLINYELDGHKIQRSKSNMPNMKQEVMEVLQPALAKEWSKGIMRLLEMYPNAKVLGLSAAPIRYLDRCRNAGNKKLVKRKEFEQYISKSSEI